MNIVIVIPVFRPDGRLKMCIERLLRQSVMPDRILLNVLYENPVDREIPEVYMDERIESDIRQGRNMTGQEAEIRSCGSWIRIL